MPRRDDSEKFEKTQDFRRAKIRPAGEMRRHRFDPRQIREPFHVKAHLRARQFDRSLQTQQPVDAAVLPQKGRPPRRCAGSARRSCASSSAAVVNPSISIPRGELGDNVLPIQSRMPTVVSSTDRLNPGFRSELKRYHRAERFPHWRSPRAPRQCFRRAPRIGGSSGRCRLHRRG